MDDGVLIARHHVIRRVHALLHSDGARKRGLVLWPKCEVWWPTAVTEPERELYAERIPISTAPGTQLLRTPIGSTEYSRCTVLQHVRNLAQPMEQLGELADAHVAFTILRSCFGACRINYVMRACPPSIAEEGAKHYDELTACTLRSLSAGAISTEMMHEFRLPVRLDEAENPHFGIGLTSAHTIASCAYLASRAATLSVTNQLFLGGAERNLSSTTHIRSAHAILSSIVLPEGGVPAVEIFDRPEGASTQHELTSMVHAGVRKNCHQAVRARRHLELQSLRQGQKTGSDASLRRLMERIFQIAFFAYFWRIMQAARCALLTILSVRAPAAHARGTSTATTYWCVNGRLMLGTHRERVAMMP